MVHQSLNNWTVEDFDVLIRRKSMYEILALYCVCVDFWNVELLQFHLLLRSLLAEHFLAEVFRITDDI